MVKGQGLRVSGQGRSPSKDLLVNASGEGRGRNRSNSKREELTLAKGRGQQRGLSSPNSNISVGSSGNHERKSPNALSNS